MSRQHFVHGFLEFVDGIDFAHKVEMGIRADRYKAMVPQVVRRAALKGPRALRPRAACARAHTKEKLKVTMPGPMTIVDTIADRHYGDRVRMALAFAALLNQEARALAADGVDVIQFDEPAFNVYMDEAAGWGIEALHRAIEGVTCDDGGANLLRLRHQGEHRLEGDARLEWRQYEKVFPALAKSRIGQVLARVPQLEGADNLLKLLDGKDVLVGVIDVASDASRRPRMSPR
jgi:5-methyltetrahydropteroyltriglutamate--homocysteine methyltransferase